MAHSQGTTARPDVDIVEQIEDRLIAHYPPAMRDRHHIRVSSQAGVITLKGYVKSPITRVWLLDNTALAEGVRHVEASELYDDESIRLDVGKLVESGTMFARIEYGIVVLSGRIPDGKTADDYAKQVAQIPGVRKVVTAFRSEAKAV